MSVMIYPLKDRADENVAAELAEGASFIAGPRTITPFNGNCGGESVPLLVTGTPLLYSGQHSGGFVVDHLFPSHTDMTRQTRMVMNSECE